MEHGYTVNGHLAFKTRQADWIGTVNPSIALVSVHSTFNEGIDGYFKMAAFISTIRENIQGKVSVLIADTAHLHTMRLLGGSLDQLSQSAQELVLRFSSYLAAVEVDYWSSSIMENPEYKKYKKQLLQLAQTDNHFMSVLLGDAESAYTEKREVVFPNKALFIEKMIDDLIEQCTCMQILAKQGYRYIFYPGTPCASTEYINHLFKNDIQWIDVFVTIEKKKKIELKPSDASMEVSDVYR